MPQRSCCRLENHQLTALQQVLAEARSARGRGKPSDRASRKADDLLLTLISDHGYTLADLSRATGWRPSALSMRLHRIRARNAADETEANDTFEPSPPRTPY